MNITRRELKEMIMECMQEYMEESDYYQEGFIGNFLKRSQEAREEYEKKLKAEVDVRNKEWEAAQLKANHKYGNVSDNEKPEIIKELDLRDPKSFEELLKEAGYRKGQNPLLDTNISCSKSLYLVSVNLINSKREEIMSLYVMEADVTKQVTAYKSLVTRTENKMIKNIKEMIDECNTQEHMVQQSYSDALSRFK